MRADLTNRVIGRGCEHRGPVYLEEIIRGETLSLQPLKAMLTFL